MDNEQSVRLDKWLKIARFFKKRAEATEAVDSGTVKVNGERVKPAKILKIGDELTIRMGTRYRNFTVKGITGKSISAKLARELYAEKEVEGVTPEMLEMMKILEAQERENRKNMKGRPTKKDRREIEKFKFRED